MAIQTKTQIHRISIDEVRQGVGLRGCAQRDRVEQESVPGARGDSCAYKDTGGGVEAVASKPYPCDVLYVKRREDRRLCGARIEKPKISGCLRPAWWI